MKSIPLRTIVCVTGACLALSSICAHAADGKKIRGIYVGLSNDLSMLEEAAEKGVNALFTGGASHLVAFNEPGKVKERETLGPRQIANLDALQAVTAKLVASIE